MNAAIWEDASSDDEYFPAEEDVRDDGEEENDGDGLYEYVEEGDEGDEEDEDLEDQHIRAHAAVDYDEEDEEEEEEVVELNIDHVLRQQDPHFLRQIQQALQRTISGRTNATPGGGGGGGGGHNHHISSVSTRSNPARRNHRSRRLLQDIPPIPFPEGKRLINSGEFGAIDDRTHKRRRFEGACTVTQFARYRELGASSKRASTIAITKRWLPKETSGRIVAQYDRHVYSGQFSHDGSFFYTASQDFKCRMYSTPNPAVPHDWTLYKVPPLSPSTISLPLLIDRLCVERLDGGQLQMRHYRTIIASWHTRQLHPAYTLRAQDQPRQWKLMPESPGKTVLARTKIKPSSISVLTPAWGEVHHGMVLILNAKGWISEPESGVYDSVPMEENSLREHQINVSTVPNPVPLVP